MELKIVDDRKFPYVIINKPIIWCWLPFIGVQGYALYSIYLSLVHKDRKCAFPSKNTLANFLKLGKATIAKYNKILEHYGLIEIRYIKDEEGRAIIRTEYYIKDVPDLSNSLAAKLDENPLVYNWRVLYSEGRRSRTDTPPHSETPGWSRTDTPLYLQNQGGHVQIHPVSLYDQGGHVQIPKEKKVKEKKIKEKNHHQRTREIYEHVTGNRWKSNDDDAYKKIENAPIDKIEQGIQIASQRASSRPNSLNYFVKEILNSTNPSEQNRSQKKKALERIVEQVRSVHVGDRDYTFPDFVEDVKRSCARNGVLFDNDLFNEIID